MFPEEAGLRRLHSQPPAEFAGTQWAQSWRRLGDEPEEAEDGTEEEDPEEVAEVPDEAAQAENSEPAAAAIEEAQAEPADEPSDGDPDDDAEAREAQGPADSHSDQDLSTVHDDESTPDGLEPNHVTLGAPEEDDDNGETNPKVTSASAGHQEEGYTEEEEGSPDSQPSDPSGPEQGEEGGGEEVDEPDDEPDTPGSEDIDAPAVVMSKSEHPQREDEDSDEELDGNGGSAEPGDGDAEDEGASGAVGAEHDESGTSDPGESGASGTEESDNEDVGSNAEDGDDSGSVEGGDEGHAGAEGDSASDDSGEGEPGGEGDDAGYEGDGDEVDSDESNLHRLAKESAALAKVLSHPMPHDPISVCSPSEISSLYDVARQEAPDIFNACTNLIVVRVCCLLPMLVLFALGSVWGHELWTKLSAGVAQPAMQRYVLSNVPFLPQPAQSSTEVWIPVYDVTAGSHEAIHNPVHLFDCCL